MAPYRWVVDIAPQKSVHRRRREESDTFAAIVTACKARFTSTTDDVGLDCDAITLLELCDGWMCGENNASRLVAENVCVGYNHGSYPASVPKVDIGSGQQMRVDQRGRVSTVLAHPQIPVLLIPIVTSPSLSPSPFFTVSRLGSDSAIQSSWAGLVKTPTLGLVMVVVMDIV